MNSKVIALVLLAMPASALGGYGIYTQIQGLNVIANEVKQSCSGQDCFVDESPRNDNVTATLALAPPAPEPILHVPLPQEVRGFYWTAETARTPRADELLQYAVETGLNAIVIDLKMDNGEIVLPSQDLIDKLGKANIYRIARLPVMRDSVYARAHPDQAIKTTSGKLWMDKTGAHWLNPAKKEVADAALDLARQAYKMGFDEIQFDYIRYASDGALSTIARTEEEKTRKKSEIMHDFFEYVGGTLQKEHIPVSFDLFGMTFLTAADFGIGQRLEDAYPFADFVSPMAYPSHYWAGYLGYDNPAAHPYEVVKSTLDKGAEILEIDHFVSSTESRPKFRPWIQDFDLGATYTSKLIEAQIKASRDAGASGWLLWNARNVYEPSNYR